MFTVNQSVLPKKYQPIKTISNMVFFANFAQEYKLNPGDLAQLMICLKKCVAAAVKYSNGESNKEKLDKLRNEFEEMAAMMGFKNVNWNSYCPNAQIEEFMIYNWPTG